MIKVLLLVALSAAPRIRGGNSDPLGVNGRVRSTQPTSLAAGSPPPTIPTGAIIALHSHQITGINGDKLTTWTNNGTIANFTQATDAAKPLLLKNSNENAVHFDGEFDIMTSTGSAATTGFVMSTGVFDLILSLRRTNSTQGQERRVVGNCEGQAGLFVGLNTEANTEGTFWIILGNGSGLLINYRTTAFAPLGAPMKILIRGDGSQLRISTNFSTFEDVAFGAGLGAGSAFYDFSVGGANPSQTTPKTFEGDMYEVLLYDRNLSAGELTQVQSYLTYYVATGI